MASSWIVNAWINHSFKKWIFENKVMYVHHWKNKALSSLWFSSFTVWESSLAPAFHRNLLPAIPQPGSNQFKYFRLLTLGIYLCISKKYTYIVVFLHFRHYFLMFSGDIWRFIPLEFLSQLTHSPNWVIVHFLVNYLTVFILLQVSKYFLLSKYLSQYY